MSNESYILGIVASLAVLAIVIEMLRRGRLRERHATWWLVAGLASVIISIFPQILFTLSDVLGIEVPSNLVFFSTIFILFLVCLQSSSELTRLEEKTRTLAEELAIIRADLNQKQK